jgi:hypothetical protein
MTVRRLMNVAEAHLLKDATEQQKINIKMLLNEPFQGEVSTEEAARQERRRMAMEIGAYAGQQELIGALGMAK